MKKVQNILKGENLSRYLNIQETIRQTRRTISPSGKNSLRRFHEDILPISGHKKELDVSFPSTSSGKILPQTNTAEEAKIESEKQLKDRLHVQLQEKSDYMLDEMKVPLKIGKHKLRKLPEASPCNTIVGSVGTETSPEKETVDQPQSMGKQKEVNMRLYDQLTPAEEEIIYQVLCNRYGKESGRRYRLVRALTAPDKETAETEVTKKKLTEALIYGKEKVECKETKKKLKGVICKEISEEVTEKMKTLVDLFSTCETERSQQPKRWKDVMRSSPVGSHKQRQYMSIKLASSSGAMSSESEYQPCTCGLLRCDCDMFKKECDLPEVEKKCITFDHDVHEANNYLITCRENLRAKEHNQLRISVLQQHAMKNAMRVTRESVYLHSAHEQAQNELMACLMSVMPPQGQELCDEGYLYVQQMANVISEHKMINEREWRVWRQTQNKMEHEDNSEELDSLDSEIESSATSNDELSECDIKFPSNAYPSRIPYFKETFTLSNVLFDKIDAKMEKIIDKNFDERMIRMKKPYTYQLQERFKHLRDVNKIFSHICKQLLSDDLFRRKLIPFSEQKRRKRVRANKKKLELKRRQHKRKLIEGMQLGKRYRKPRRSHLYTEQENYRGFSPRRQKILNKQGVEKFRKCNLVGGNFCGWKLTKKVIHNDYRLIRRLFDNQSKMNKESLWDPGMKARMEEFSTIFKERQGPTVDEEYDEEVEEDPSDSTVRKNQSRRPVKEELLKTQTAQTKCSSNCTRSTANRSELFASMMRSLRNDAKSIACPVTEDHDNHSSSRMQTATSFGKTTLGSSSFDPVSEWPLRNVRRASGFSCLPSRRGKPQEFPSSQPPHPVKRRPKSFILFPPPDGHIENSSKIRSKTSRGLTMTKIGKTTASSISFKEIRERPFKRTQKTLDFGSSQQGKSQQRIPFQPRTPEKSRANIPGSFMSIGPLKTVTSVPRMSNSKRPVLKKNLLEESTKSLSAIQNNGKPSVSNNPRKRLPKSASSTVR